MKRAFTMIELIFVIVIIGILSVIALPKLSATRTDAKVSTIVSSLREFVIESSAFYTSKGETEWQNANITDITNIPIFTNEDCSNQADSSTGIIGNSLYICNDDKYVIKLDANKTHLKVAKNSNNNSLIAQGVYNNKAFKALNINSGIRLSGVGIKR